MSLEASSRMKERGRKRLPSESIGCQCFTQPVEQGRETKHRLSPQEKRIREEKEKAFGLLPNPVVCLIPGVFLPLVPWNIPEATEKASFQPQIAESIFVA